MKARILAALVLVLVMFDVVSAGNTGKIAGRVTTTETKEALAGVSVRVVGTTLGASTDADGNYTIISIPPGAYSVSVTGVGVQKKEFRNVKIAADFTTRLDIDLSTDVIALDAVVVQAEAPMIRKDLTSSRTSIDAAEIHSLPVESVTQLLTLQAGIIQGAGGELHIRGGRSSEISYTVNGVSISNPFDNTKTVQIATNAIQELSVVSGTFNAEYGNALSGVVNTITKEGGSTYRGSISAYTGGKVSTHDNIFYNIRKVDPFSDVVTEGTLSGPIPGASEQLSFFFSGRYEHNKGWLFGRREHLPTDSVTRSVFNPSDVRVSTSGNNELVAMNPGDDFSGTGKISFTPIPTVKLRYDALYSTSKYKYYNHDLKYNPDASYNNKEWGLLNSLEARHSIDDHTFYTLKGSYSVNDFKQYLYPLLDASGNEVNYYPGSVDITTLHADPRYQPDYKNTRAMNYTFLTGGTSNGQYYQRSKTVGGKFDLTSQVNKNHEVKVGAEYKAHRLDFENFSVLRDTTRYLTPTIPSTSTANHDAYVKRPKEFSAYIQDKMEFESMILNVGLRYDYFRPGSVYSTNIFYPSPYDPSISFPPGLDVSSLLKKAGGKHQLSPRIGISFPITDKGIIHFSYGHFFQMPPFQYLYANPNFKSSYAVGTPLFGNANLNPEKTVTYEIGLQQQILENLAFNVTGYYKDVRDLLALQQIRISGSATYLKYVNKDYGNIKGITFSLTKRRSAGDLLGVTVDYTFQVSEGNDTNVDAFFLDLSSGRQSEKIPVYLSWDQTHTVNTTVTVGEPGDWNVTLVGRLGTGLPYTPQITQQTVYLRTNSGRKPSQATVDLMADKTFRFFGADITAFVKVFNLFDTLNERLVYNDTGRATYTLVQIQGAAVETDKLAERVQGVHSAQEYFARPDFYQPPREVRVGMSVEF